MLRVTRDAWKPGGRYKRLLRVHVGVQSIFNSFSSLPINLPAFYEFQSTYRRFLVWPLGCPSFSPAQHVIPEWLQLCILPSNDTVISRCRIPIARPYLSLVLSKILQRPAHQTMLSLSNGMDNAISTSRTYDTIGIRCSGNYSLFEVSE